MNKLFKRIFTAALSAALVPVSGLLPSKLSIADTASAASAGTVVRLNPSEASPFNNGEFQGWGTSLCWWANRLGYSEKLTQQAADAFFSDSGLGLDIARYNLGGGDDPTHNHITRSDSKVPGVWSTFTLSDDGKDVSSITYDITKDQNQLNIAKAALAANPNLCFEGFSNSAPYFMTVTGCSSGGDPADSDNLQADMYDDFGKFIADATNLFKQQGIVFQSYSPMNEPDTSYWGVNSYKQEGCHFDPGESQSKAIVETRKALDNAGLTDVIVAGMDETDLGKTVSNFPKLTDEAKADLGRIDTHTYSGSDRAGVKSTASNAGKNLWMSEVDGNWDMFGLASRIITDMNGMQPSAWVMWDIVDKHKDSDFTAPDGTKTEASNSLSATDSLWGVGMADHDTETLELANKYYGFGQFTRYITPGDTIIASSSSSLAAYNKTTGDIKIVAVNSSSSDAEYTFDLSAFTNPGTTVTEIRTNNKTGDSAEHWKEITGEATVSGKKLSSTLKAQTITTYIVKGVGKTDYAYITGGGSEIEKGASVQLDIIKNFDGDVVWSSSDTSVAEVSSTGLVTAKSAGNVTITATSGGCTFTREFTVPLYKLTGSASWGNDSNRPDDSADYTKAADGSLDTYFDGTTGGYVEYDYGTPFKIEKILLAPRTGSGMPERTKGAKVQASNDGINWTDLYVLSSALSEGYTEITADKLNSSKAYRYFRYTNEENMANIAEFTLEGSASSDVPTDDPSVKDISEFTDNFEGVTNIFGAPTGDLSADGAQIYACGLDRFGSVFVPARATATVSAKDTITLTANDLFRLEFDMFAGWETNGKDNTFAIKDKDGNEIVALYLTGGGYNLTEVRIGGMNVLSSPTVAQCRSNPGTSKAGANGWGASGQPYVNTVGYNKHAEITITGAGAVNISFTGGMADTIVSGVLDSSVTIGSMEFTGDCNSARTRVAAYDNIDADVITYKTEFAKPTATPEPTATPDPTSAPVVPDNGALISLDFDNGDLTSASSYGKASGSPAFVTEDGKACVKLDGTRNTAITLTDANGNSLLTGFNNLTVKFKIKPEGTETSWWFFAAPSDSAQTYQKEQYLGAMTNGTTLTVERYSNSGSRSTSATGAFNSGEWNDVTILVKDSVTEVYINGALSGSADSVVDISQMLGTSSVAYIGLANWGSGEFASGYIDDFEIYSGLYENPLYTLDLGDLSAVTSDIALPAALSDGTAVSWASSDESVVTSAGAVTRMNDTKTAKLTASAVIDGTTYTKEFTVTVLGYGACMDNFAAYADGNVIRYSLDNAPDYSKSVLLVALYDNNGRLISVKRDSSIDSFETDGGNYRISAFLWNKETLEPMHETETRNVKAGEQLEMAAYLFVHFAGTESGDSDEQIYFSVSQDGQNWTTLNSQKPILSSNVGEKGVRDPHVIRSEDGKYFIIATDLSIYNRRGDSNRWSTCQTSGSKSIVIWESDDLVNWSDARLVKVAPDNAGCTWAPEAVYDAAKDMYMVFWASKVSDDNYSTQRIYRSYTSDFKEFTEPEVYIDGGSISNIDTTIVSDKGVYYRFTKNESKSSVTMMKSTDLNGTWTDVDTYTINGAAGNTVTGYEGPTAYKINGTDNWTLLLDYYSKSQGYKPFVTSDITTGIFTSATDFTTDMKYRHGTVMPITQAEYDRLTEAYK